MNNDKLTVNETRDVAPQWSGGKGGNLGDFTLTTIGFSPDGVIEIVKEPGMAAAIADVLNNQLHIRFGSGLCSDAVAAKLGEEKSKDEKLATFRERTLAKAREVAKTVLNGFVLDEVAAFKRWAVEDFPKRGVRSDKRPVLGDYDKIVSGVESHWATMTDDRRAKLVERLKLADELTAGTKSEVIAAIAKRYQRPVAVDADALFADESGE